MILELSQFTLRGTRSRSSPRSALLQNFITKGAFPYMPRQYEAGKRPHKYPRCFRCLLTCSSARCICEHTRAPALARGIWRLAFAQSRAHARTGAHTHTRARVPHAHARPRARAHTDAPAHARTHPHTHICMRARAHTHAHTHPRARTRRARAREQLRDARTRVRSRVRCCAHRYTAHSEM